MSILSLPKESAPQVNRSATLQTGKETTYPFGKVGSEEPTPSAEAKAENIPYRKEGTRKQERELARQEPKRDSARVLSLTCSQQTR